MAEAAGDEMFDDGPETDAFFGDAMAADEMPLPQGSASSTSCLRCDLCGKSPEEDGEGKCPHVNTGGLKFRKFGGWRGKADSLFLV